MQTKKENKKQTVKDFLTSAAAFAGSMGATAGAMAGTEAFIRADQSNYPNIHTPAGVDLTNKIVTAHRKATGLSDPVQSSAETMPRDVGKRFEYGGYLPRQAVKLFNKYSDTVLDIPENEGTVITGPRSTAFVMAHELGHRAQDYHPIGGPSQVTAALPAFAGGLATLGLSATAKTNRGAVAKGLLASYIGSAPRIISELTATRLGNEYIKASGVEPNKTVSALQPIGYLLQPAAEAAANIALGRLVSPLIRKLKNKKNKAQQETTVSPEVQSVV